MRWWTRLRREDRLERELDAEVRYHMDRRVQDFVQAGLPEREARRRARFEFGGLDQVKEECRDARGTRWIADIGRDVRSAVRLFAKHRVPALAIIVTLATALGLNASVFAVADAVILRPFSLPRVDQLVLVTETSPDNPPVGFTSPANFLDWQRQARTVGSLSAVALRDIELGGRPEPERLHGAMVSSNFFDLVGVAPVVGRGFVAEEGTSGRHQRAVLSNGLWRRLFSGDRSIVGRSIVLDGQSFQIVGIAPAAFDFPPASDLWLPLAFDQDAVVQRDERTLLAMGRLSTGSTLQEAQAEMEVVGGDLARRYPDSNANHGVRVQTLAAGLTEEGMGPLLAFMQASALFVLLIACANITNLLLALGVERQREIAVRFALGAARARIVRALCVESGLLALVSIPLAIAVAASWLEIVTATMPARLASVVPGWQTIHVSGRLVIFTVASALVAAVLFSVAPALHSSRQSSDGLKESRMTAGAARQRLRRALIVVQIALVLPLLVAAGLSWRGTSRFVNGPQGYEPRNLLTVGLNLPERAYPDPDSERRFVGSAIERLTGRGDVLGAAAASNLPSSGWHATRRVAIEGQSTADTAASVDVRVVSSEYFDTMRIHIVKGRGFTQTDRNEALPVAIVSRSLAEGLWPGADPIGRRVSDAEQADAPWITIVGVANDVIQDWFWGRNAPTIYRPYQQEPVRDIALAIRTAGDPAAATPQVAASIHALDPDRPLLDVMTMDKMISERMTLPRQVAMLEGTLGIVALILAGVGLYGVITYLVSQRTHEIGVRLVLGASGRDVLHLVFGQASRLMLVGVTLGGLLAIATARVVETMLEGIATLDLRLLIASMATVAAVGLIAAYLPARRALTIEPVIALRTE